MGLPAYGGSYQSPYGSYGAGQPGPSSYGGPGRGPQGGGYAPQHKEPYQWRFEDYAEADRKQPQKKKRKSGAMIFALLLSGVVGLAILFSAGYGIYSWLQDNMDFPPLSSSHSASSEASGGTPELLIKDTPENSAAQSAEGRLSAVEMARVAKPSVVGISQYSSVNSLTASGEGSGIVMNEEGYIITNAHVVEGAIAIQVSLYNGETYPAEVVGIDTRTDLAVIKIEAEGLAAAEFGDSDRLEVGESVMAIGNPGGLQLAGSVTMGIISAVDRPIKPDGGGYSINYIQTDAAINPGNSGGPLVNEYGQVVGINSAKIVAEGYEGIGFAIPINDAKPIIDDLIAHGRVTGRTKIGISGQEINEITASLNDLPTGIYIRSIEAGSALAGTDVMVGDIITKIDGTEIASFDDVSDILSTKKPGDQVELTLYRPYTIRQGGGGKTFTAKITLVEDGSDQAP
jgi:serine protease Do